MALTGRLKYVSYRDMDSTKLEGRIVPSLPFEFLVARIECTVSVI
jgi:hypothetical protein